jgi:hypothetical protein
MSSERMIHIAKATRALTEVSKVVSRNAGNNVCIAAQGNCFEGNVM